MVRLMAAAALVTCAGLGLWAYTVHRSTQALGVEVYYELEGDGLPVPQGVLDDPVFSDLPVPTDRPRSLGRYRPPAVAPPSTAQPPVAPTPPAPRSQGSGAESQEALSPAAVQPPVAAPPPVPGLSPRALPQQPAASAPVPTAAPALAPTDFTSRLRTSARIHLLLIANDQETLGSGRADVLLVLTLDPRARLLTLLSIPRDTRITLPGRGQVKINAAYAVGGATAQTQAVERFLGIPMDKYVEISLGGFREAIDLVGGVDVNPKFGFQLDGSVFRPGKVHIGGEQALAYARMRKSDPLGDLGRNTRQQEVVRQLMAALGQRSTADLQSLLSQLAAHLRTNFSPSEVVRLRAVHAYLLERQRTAHVQGVNRKINGIWFYLVSDAERRRLHLLLQ